MKALLMLWSLLGLVACGSANRSMNDHLRDSRFEPVHQVAYHHEQAAFDIVLYEDWFTERYIVIVRCPEGQAVSLGRFFSYCHAEHCLNEELRQFTRMRWDIVQKALQ